MCALFKRGRTDDFRRKPLNYFSTPMPVGVGVEKAFASLPKACYCFFSKSDRILFSQSVFSSISKPERRKARSSSAVSFLALRSVRE